MDRAKELHPDKGGEGESEEFQQLQEAKDTLLDRWGEGLGNLYQSHCMYIHK